MAVMVSKWEWEDPLFLHTWTKQTHYLEVGFEGEIGFRCLPWENIAEGDLVSRPNVVDPLRTQTSLGVSPGVPSCFKSRVNLYPETLFCTNFSSLSLLHNTHTTLHDSQLSYT